jgi:hypothetical protein
MIVGRCAAEVAAQAVLAVWNDVSLRATQTSSDMAPPAKSLASVAAHTASTKV